MKCSLFLLLCTLAVSLAQRFFPAPFPDEGDEYAASLADAPVGTYSRTRDEGFDERGLYYGRDRVSGISLGRAKVGIYGNDRRENRIPLRG